MYYIIHTTVRFSSDELTLERIHEPHMAVTLTVTMSRLLLYLIINHGNNVTRDSIFTEVWEAHGLRASTNSLNKYISELRQMFRVLGLDDEVIVTIPKVGFSISSAIISYHQLSSAIITSTITDAVSQSNSVGEKSLLVDRGYRLFSYRYILPVITILLFSVLLIYIFQFNVDDGNVSVQKTYPIGMVDSCPVFSLKPVTESLKPRNMDITKSILKSLSINCEEGGVYYVQFSNDVVYHHAGRVFIAGCTIRNIKDGSLSSCYNYYGGDYETKN